jgi:hypothetical protein
VYAFTEDILDSDDDTPSAKDDLEINAVLKRLGWLNCWYSYVIITFVMMFIHQPAVDNL